MKNILITIILISIIPTIAFGNSWEGINPPIALDDESFAQAENFLKGIIKVEKLLLAATNPGRYAQSINNLGELYRNMGRYEAAEPLIREALEIRKKVLGIDHIEYANSLNSLGLLYLHQGKYKKAEPLLTECLRIIEGNSDIAVHSILLNNLALLYYNKGDYRQAELHYNKSLAFRKQIPDSDPLETAVILNGLGGVYRSMGRYKKAEEKYMQCFEIHIKNKKNRHPNYAACLNNLGELYLLKGQYGTAQKWLEKSLSICKNTLLIGTAHPMYANVLNNLALLHYQRGSYNASEKLYNEILSLYKKRGETAHPTYAKLLNNLAVLYRTMGRYEQALLSAMRSLSIIEKLSSGNQHPFYGNVYSNIAGIHLEMSNNLKSQEYFIKANNNMLQQIVNYFPALSEKERGLLYNTITLHFEAFNSFVLLRHEKQPELVGMMYNNQLALKGLLLHSSQHLRKIVARSGDENLIDQFDKLIMKREYLMRTYTLSQRELKKQAIHIRTLEKEANDLEKKLASNCKEFADAMKEAAPTWLDVQQQLKVGEAAVEIVQFRKFEKDWTEKIQYVALIVTEKTQRSPEMVLLPNGNSLESKHQYLHEYLIASGSGQKNKAYEYYWKPIKEKLQGIKKVYFSPDGIYYQINLNILFNPETEKHVLDEIDIHSVTNTKDILTFGKYSNSSKQAVLLGNPAFSMPAAQHKKVASPFKRMDNIIDSWNIDFEPDGLKSVGYFDELKKSEDEIKDIADTLKRAGWEIDLYLKERALEEAVKSIKKPKILHLATHGFFILPDSSKSEKNLLNFLFNDFRSTAINTNPMLRSGIVFAGANTYLHSTEKYDTEDGILTAYEAANLNLHSTELVGLSACSTGAGVMKNGEGIYGLQRAFKVAGAKTILMALEKVSSEITQKLMKIFYKEWIVNGYTKHEAFRIAQQKIREKHKKPYQWGAFVMVGE